MRGLPLCACEICSSGDASHLICSSSDATTYKQERRTGIDCEALEADLACMQRAAQLAADTKASEEAMTRCAVWPIKPLYI